MVLVGVVAWLLCGLGTLWLCVKAYGLRFENRLLPDRVIQAIGLVLIVILWPFALWDLVR
jgi:hypothetical protein